MAVEAVVAAVGLVGAVVRPIEAPAPAAEADGLGLGLYPAPAPAPGASLVDEATGVALAACRGAFASLMAFSSASLRLSSTPFKYGLMAAKPPMVAPNATTAFCACSRTFASASDSSLTAAASESLQSPTFCLVSRSTRNARYRSESASILGFFWVRADATSSETSLRE